MSTRIMLRARVVEHSNDTVLNLQYKKHARVIAFADDLMVMIRAESIGEAENNANIEMDKISKWAGENKI